MFSVHTTPEEFRSGKSHYYIVFEKAPFYDETFSVHTKISKFDQSEELRFRDGLVWTLGLTVEIKLRFQIPPA